MTVVRDKFKVFISWSGDLAKAVAFVWNDLLEDTFDSVQPFMSEDDIGAGERGLTKIAAELAGTSFGIVVVTQENENSPWINFEAGALSKDVNDDTVRVAPSLVDFERKSDLTGPLKQFQGGLLDKAGIEYILVEIAKIIGASELTIKKRFANSWSEYEERFTAAKAVSGGTAPAKHRSQPDILDEILTTVRSLARDTGAANATANTANTNASLALALVKASNTRDGALVNASNARDFDLRLRPGDQVRHASFGDGVVESVEGDGARAISVVDFVLHGQKRIMHNQDLIRKIVSAAQEKQFTDPTDSDTEAKDTD
jgi:hypothetical protein